ncbi:DUF6630 family protein [Microbacterium memoriense]|uniref:DUF6630 domain-containing protein n=1 Tax=Microbacterium memoriense TaxID=2978350 RepID=A0ABT2P9J6_9MICO|nr:hypothetical protein [Microbacterium memoriense]MCT9001265.1 hypothetical protein [Microbacterium memoriense]
MIEDWLRLGALLEDDSEVADSIRRSGGAGEDVRAALFDALDDAGALAYMEWSDSGVELADALAQLPRVFRTGADLDEVGDVDGALSDAIAEADGILSGHGLCTLYLDEGSDACPLVVVARSDVDEITALAARLSITARTF